jgi:hypothetical protein
MRRSPLPSVAPTSSILRCRISKTRALVKFDVRHGDMVNCIANGQGLERRRLIIEAPELGNQEVSCSGLYL